jgi:hypothetical protein
MNTVILVSVLSTLGVVAILAGIVVAFMKVNRKVDDNEYIKKENTEIYRTIDHLSNHVDERYKDCCSFVDSRCDKLDNKICGKNCKCNPTQKQILTD